MFLTRRSFLGPLLASPLAGAYAAAAQSCRAVEDHAHRDGVLEEPRRRPVLAALDLGQDRYRRGHLRASARLIRATRRRRPWFTQRPPRCIGRDPRDIERIWADLYRAFDFQVAGGAEIRALSAIDLALVGPARETSQRARVPADRRQGEPAGPPLQHLLPLQIRFQPRTGEDHARADRHARHQGHQGLAVRRRGGAQPEPVHHPAGHRRGARRRSRSCARRSVRRSRSPWSFTRSGMSLPPFGLPTRSSPTGRCGSKTC